MWVAHIMEHTVGGGEGGSEGREVYIHRPDRADAYLVYTGGEEEKTTTRTTERVTGVRERKEEQREKGRTPVSKEEEEDFLTRARQLLLSYPFLAWVLVEEKKKKWKTNRERESCRSLFSFLVPSLFRQAPIPSNSLLSFTLI